jgi:regulator of cell morphogenesis and NO signaling
MSDVILSNPYLMLMLEHFDIDLVVHEKTVEQVCTENNIGKNLFLTFANLFNGYNPSSDTEYSFHDIQTIVSYLKRSHEYYLEEKYPKIRSYIKMMYEVNDHAEILMLDRFFNEYFNEVSEHLEYENRVVFPYVISMYNQLNHIKDYNMSIDYSAAEYKEHHNNIEEKLNDLKNLLIKYMPQKNDQKIRRKLLFGLFELEYDLNIHSLIEDTILIPLVEKMEDYIKQRTKE